VKIRILTTLVAVVLFGLHLNSCSSCKKKEPNESKTSNSTGCDKTAPDTGKTTLDNAGDKLVQEREWVKTIIEFVAIPGVIHNRINDISGIDNTSTMTEVQLKTNGAIIRGCKIELLTAIEKFQLLLYNSAVTKERLKAGLDSLLAGGEVISDKNKVEHMFKCFENDKAIKDAIERCNDSIVETRNKMKNWDEVVKDSEDYLEPIQQRMVYLKKALDALLGK
jgi:hypothetical protein